MRCSSAGSICHSPFSSLEAEIFPASIARRIAVLFRPTAAAAVARLCMGTLPIVGISKYGGTAILKNGVMIFKSENYHFHRLDLSRQGGFIVTVYDEDGLRLGATEPCSTPATTFAEGRKIVDGKIEGPRK
jgi:hypothetical protein